MTFGEALEALKDGDKVTREVWEGYWFIKKPTVLDNYGEPQYMEHMIIAKLKTGELVPAQPYQQDLLAEDWYII